MKTSIRVNFAKYVSTNILGMLGLSCYILADTFFVAKALGANGLAALNLSISVYSFINGIGLMVGIGGATRYSILRAGRDDTRANKVFTTAIILGVMLGLGFMGVGIFGSEALADVLGANSTTLIMTKTYLMTILVFAPFFILNNIVLAFVRNDNNPRLSMSAMLAGSLSNVILDYVFMFPLGMGMFGAAFATGLAPIISLCILSLNFIRRDNSLRMIRFKMHWSTVYDIILLGLSSFITEISSGIVLITFNLEFLSLGGNLGVAAYGIVANISLVGIAVFVGIAQGIQPLVSMSYGSKNLEMLRKVMKYAILTSLFTASLIYLIIITFAGNIVSIFNSEQNHNIARTANEGLRIYFIGFLFAGINIITTTYLSASERAKEAFAISTARGLILIIPFVFLLSRLWGITGIWLSFVLTEAIITIIILLLYKVWKTKYNYRKYS